MAGGRRKAGGARLLTIMFTDIEESTALTQRLGDARAQEIVRAHNNLVRAQIARFGGTEIKHTGDGVMATFESAWSAVAAATAMQQESRAYNEEHPESSFLINVGLNAGEPVAEDADVFGSAVQLAARACAAASGGRVLATNVVRELVYGKGVLFEDRGPTEMKGFDQPVRLYDVSGVEPDALESAAREGEGRRRHQLPVFVSVAVLVVLLGVVVAVLAGRDSGGGGTEASTSGSSSAPPPGAKRVRYNAHGTTELVSLTGDCVSSDTVVAGIITMQVRGGLAGSSRTEYEATIELERECTGMHLKATGTYDLNDGSFANPTRGVSLETLGDDVTNSRFSSTVALGPVRDGTRAYEGATGFNICTSDSLRTNAELTNSSECELVIYPKNRRPPMVVAAVADAEQISTRVGSGGNQLRMLVLVENTSKERADDAVLTLQGSGKSVIRAEAADDATAVSDLAWKIGSLDPGEARWVTLLVEVIKVDGKRLVLTPRVTASGTTTVGWPAKVNVGG